MTTRRLNDIGAETTTLGAELDEVGMLGLDDLAERSKRIARERDHVMHHVRRRKTPRLGVFY